MGIKWNSDADFKLIIAMAAGLTSNQDWENVAERMGEGCTVSALKHRIARLKSQIPDESKAPSPASRVSKNKSPKKSNKKVAPEIVQEKNPASSDDQDNGVSEAEVEQHAPV